nr:putative ribonuclease H-like domain-containing protein [Tanacetum cinerariifolium]
ESVNEPIDSETTIKKHVVDTSEAKASAYKTKVVRKNENALIVEDWVSDNEDVVVSKPKIKKKTVKPSFAKIDTNNTNGVVNAAHEVSTASSQVNTINASNSDNLSDAVICAFLASQPSSPQLVNEDLEQIYPDNLEEIDLKWQMAMLTMRARRTTSRRTRRRNMPIETPASTALVSCDGLGGNFMPLKPDLPGLEESVAKPLVSEPTSKKPIDEPGEAKDNAVKPKGNPKMDLQDKRVIDSGCSRHMTGNMSYLQTIKKLTKDMLPLEVTPKERKSQAKIQSKLLTDESHVLFKVPRKNNMYIGDLKNIVPKEGLTCLFAKETSDESKLWHKRPGHINFKTMNKLVKRNLVRDLPSKLFEDNQTRVACQKIKQHRASCKSKTVSSISQPLHMLHMDLFDPTFVKSLMKKMYCLVVTDDYSKFTWIFFLATKDETSGILKSFINGVENIIDQRVKVIRYDNET